MEALDSSTPLRCARNDRGVGLVNEFQIPAFAGMTEEGEWQLRRRFPRHLRFQCAG